MSDILGAIIYGENMNLLGKDPLEPPYSDDEECIIGILQALDEHTAFCLRDSIEMLVMERHIEAFRSGVRFGVRLGAELSAGAEEDL